MQMRGSWLCLLGLAACNQSQSPATATRAGLQTVVGEDVSWTSVVNCAANGSTLTKTGGLPWADDAGAISTKQLTAGDGYVELTISDTTTFRMIGLTHAHSGTTSGDIDYAFRLQSGYASPYEHGAWRLDGQMAGGDTLRIAVESGQVKFYRNGGLVYTSAIAPTYPLFVAASLIDAGGTITGTRLGLPGSAPAGTTFLSEPTAQPSAGGATVAWTTPVAAGGDVDYGPTVAYGTRAHDPAVGTQHQVTLSGLTGGTLYHYRVVSTDGAGNTVTSADRTLTAGAGSASRAHRFCGWTLADGYEDPSADPGYTTFAAHADSFDAVHPVWWHLGADMLTFTRVYGEGDATITRHTTAAGQPTQLIPTIAAVDGSEPSRVAAMLGNATARSQHAAAIRNLVLSKGYDGIDLDYEHLSDANRAGFSAFATELGGLLHAAGKTLSFAVTALTAPTGPYDYEVLSAAADQLHVMAYDFHFLGTHPGPVAPLGWVQAVANYIKTIGGGQRTGKFILGVPNYGLAGSDGSVTTWAGNSTASLTAAGAGYATTTDHMNSCSYGYFAPGRAPNAMTSHGHLFFDDLLSHEEKVVVAAGAGLGGIAYWTIGGEPYVDGRTFFDMVRTHFPKQ